MASRFTERDSTGTVHIKSWAIPLVVIALVLPIVSAIVVGIVGGVGAGIGLAAGFAAVVGLTVFAARTGPDGPLEVAPRRDAERRILVVATAEVTPAVAERVAEVAADADEVRLLIPVRARQIDRWLSSTDGAREGAQDTLAHTAGALVAAGLPVSGALGDGDAGQALEDELRSYPAQGVVLVSAEGASDPFARRAERLGLPLTRVSSS